jgi:hypothetical protein
MKMQLVQRIYPGNVPRPAPFVLEKPENKLIVVATPWGTNLAAENAAQSVAEYYALSKTDREATSPYAKLPGLSSLANSLRLSTLIANESIYKNFNANELSTACEMMALAIEGRELTWVQIGQPHLLVVRKGFLVPLEVALDLSTDFPNTAPLPSKLLGIDRQSEVETKSITVQSGDVLLLLARSFIPSSLFTLPFGNSSVNAVCDQVFQTVVRSNPEMPFWVGAFQI